MTTGPTLPPPDPGPGRTALMSPPAHPGHGAHRDVPWLDRTTGELHLDRLPRMRWRDRLSRDEWARVGRALLGGVILCGLLLLTLGLIGVGA